MIYMNPARLYALVGKTNSNLRSLLWDGRKRL